MSSHCTQSTMSSNFNVDGSSLQLLLEFSPWMHTTTVWIFSSHNYVKSHLRQKSVYCFSLVDVITSFLSSGLFTPETHFPGFQTHPMTDFFSYHPLLLQGPEAGTDCAIPSFVKETLLFP